MKTSAESANTVTQQLIKIASQVTGQRAESLNRLGATLSHQILVIQHSDRDPPTLVSQE